MAVFRVSNGIDNFDHKGYYMSIEEKSNSLQILSGDNRVLVIYAPGYWTKAERLEES